MLARGFNILGAHIPYWMPLAVLTDRVAIDGKTGKPVADVTRYTYHDADTRYGGLFERQKTILQAILTDRAPLAQADIARLIGFDGAYHRFTGKVTIEKFEGGVRVERFDDRAIWELMYFGKARFQGLQIQNSKCSPSLGISVCPH